MIVRLSGRRGGEVALIRGTRCTMLFRAGPARVSLSCRTLREIEKYK